MSTKKMLSLIALSTLSLIAQGHANVCDRHPHIVDSILEQTHKGNCAAVTDEDLAKMDTLYVYYEWHSESTYGTYALKAGPKAGQRTLRKDILKELRPEWLKGMTGLKTITIEGSEISKIEPGTWLPLGNDCNGQSCVTSLSLSHSKLSYIPSDAFENLGNLTELEIDSQNDRADQIVHLQIEAGAFDNLPEVTSIDIDNGFMKELPANLLINNEKLVKLDLAGNMFTSAPRGMFNNLRDNCGVVELGHGNGFKKNVIGTIGKPAFKQFEKSYDVFVDNLDREYGKKLRIIKSNVFGITGLSEISGNGGC